MPWYNSVPGRIGLGVMTLGGSEVARAIGKDALLGGTSKTPSEYRQDFAHQGQIMDAINRGIGTNNVAPQTTMGGDFRNAQTQQLGQLQRLASGQERGAGELSVDRQVQNALAGQQAMARMARGGAGAALRGAANNAATIGLSGAGQAQEAALRDQQAAQGLLTQAAQAGRAGDQQIQLANMDAQLKTMGMNDQARLAYLAQLTGMDATQLQQQMQAYQIAQQRPGYLGPGLAAAGQVGAAAAMSDERLKTDIEEADEDIDDMLDRLVAKRYRYKDELKHGAGERVGIMAQDAERSTAGATMIRETADGKAIDTNKAVSVALAAVARLNQRLRAVEDHHEEMEDEEMGPPAPSMMIMMRRKAAA